jgi:serine protease AprX
MMGLPRSVLEWLIFGGSGERRFTQDTPVLPDVWIRFGQRPDRPLELLLTPDRAATPGEVAVELRKRLGADGEHNIVYTPTTIAVMLGFEELVRHVLPMTSWWKRRVWKKEVRALLAEAAGDELIARLARGVGRLDRERERQPGERKIPLQGETSAEEKDKPEGAPNQPPLDVLWMLRIVGWIAWARKADLPEPRDEPAPEKWVREHGPAAEEIAARAWAVLGHALPEPVDRASRVWQVNRNRAAKFAVRASRLAVKADAAHALFKVTCKNLAWAVIDGGIDATHPAFRLREPGPDGTPYPAAFEVSEGRWTNRTRVVATYDFTIIRTLLNPRHLEPGRFPDALAAIKARLATEEGAGLEDVLSDLRKRLQNGGHVDWGLLEPFLRVPHELPSTAEEKVGDPHRWYWVPPTDHGTHVAGILAADWPCKDAGAEDGEEESGPLEGICPDLRLYDVRVIPVRDAREGDEDGGEEEFNVIAALQFIRYLNAQKNRMVVHGTNVSLSIPHEVANFACGRTPVCDECERLVASGVVVVAAAGNNGYLRYRTSEGEREGYHTISITDPGNAEGVITVGATHRNRPHTYGVSYFSSRGPTGDGRIKPDLVAPGEKIVAPVPAKDQREKDGTSMAAPHVSGAAAMLMARYNELLGQPGRIKRILCETATDLGRERYFQGSGMLDVLRALQSV